MMAVILAGGKGARLRPFTMNIPKPLLPLGEVPIIEVVIRQLAKAGVDRIVVTLGHMAPIFTAFVGNGSQWGASVEYCYEDQPLGTAGPIRLVSRLDDQFLVMNGDLLTTLDYCELFAAHYRYRATGTIAVHRREVNIDYGVIKTTEDGMLAEYVEKPTITYAVSMGINVLSRECLDLIPPGCKFDIPELMQAIRRAGKTVVCYSTDCYWQDIGRFDDYQQASADFVADPSRFLAFVRPVSCKQP